MQKVFRVVMAAGLAVFIVSWVLFFFVKLPVERIALVGFGLCSMAVGLESFGQALFLHWKRELWKPPPGKPATVQVGRLSSLAGGIFSSALGVGFLGYGWMPEAAYVVVMVAVLAGFGLMWVGWSLDKCGAEPDKLDDESPSGVDQTLIVKAHGNPPERVGLIPSNRARLD